MDKLHSNISKAIQEEPSYEKLETLRSDVKMKLTTTNLKEGRGLLDFAPNPVFKGVGLALLIVSCLALSQLSFRADIQSDLFDLRYFSSQMVPTTDVIVLASYEVKP